MKKGSNMATPTYEEIMAILRETAQMQQRHQKEMEEYRKRQEEENRKIQELREAQKATDEQLKKTDEQIEKMSKRLDRLGVLVGNISNNQGDVAEEYFVNSLKDVLEIGDLHFDYLLQNVRLQTKKINDEFDILLVNGESVAIIEVKYKVHPKVIDSLDKKIEHLKLMKEYNNYKIYAGVAGFYVPDEVIEKAKEKGYFVLKRKGNIIQEYTDNLIPA